MELTAELMNKIEKAYSAHRLVGDAFFSESEYEALLQYTRGFCSQFLRGGGSYMRGDDSVHFVTLIEIAKRWKGSADDDDESGFWPHVYNTINAVGYQSTNQKEYSAYTDIIRGIEKARGIPTEKRGHRFYATLMMHAFAPYKSIKAFLDLCYNIYKKDIDFDYTANDRWVCEESAKRFCEILEHTAGGDKTVSVGTNTYAVKIGLRSFALNAATRGDFTALMDRTLTAIHKLFHKQGFNIESYFDGQINDWWQGKLAEVAGDKKTRHRVLSAVTKQTIAAKLMRDEKKVTFTIPPIRLDNRGCTIWLSVYAGENLEQRYSDDMPTRYGELTVTTAQKEFELNDLLRDDKGIRIRVEIAENGINIFEKTIEREFILFDGENEVLSQLSKVNNYFVYARDIDALRMPTECSTAETNLYNIYPREGEVIQGTNQSVYFVDRGSASTRKGEIDLLGGISDCEWLVGETGHTVFGGQVRLLVPDEISLNGLELRIGDSRKLLTDLQSTQEDGFRLFDITGRVPQLESVEIAVYSHLKEKCIAKERIAIFPNLNVSFSKAAFYGSDEKKLTISVDDASEILTWDNTQSEVVYPLSGNHDDGELIIKIPYTRWRINDKPWQNKSFDKRVWYKDHFHNGSFLEIESVLDMTEALLYAIVDRELSANQDLVERNKDNGKFEIGKYIFAHENHCEIVFLLKPNRNTRPIELFIVSTKEHFEYPPIGVVDDKVVFVGGENFIGTTGRNFTIEFKSVGRDPIIVQSDRLENGVIPDISEGIYWGKVSSKDGGMFAKTERIFWQGEFIFGDRDRLKLANIVLRISPIAGIGMTDSFWSSSKQGYRISNLKRTEDNADTYTARIYYTDGDGNRSAVCGINDCMVEIISPSALRILVTDEKEEYTQKFTFDSGAKRISAPNLENRFSITNYQFLEVKDV